MRRDVWWSQPIIVLCHLVAIIGTAWSWRLGCLDGWVAVALLLLLSLALAVRA